MKRILSIVLAPLILVVGVLGQANSAVTGVVTDASGAVVPGVKVTLADTKTSREQTTVTNDQGSYSFKNLQPGSGFKLTFAGQGFQTYVLNEVQLGIGVTETHNIQLTAGQVSESVEVVSTSGDATLNTTDASLGNIIGTRQLRELPIQIRGTPAALIGLQPGAVGSNVFAGATGGNRTGSVTGSRADQGNITVDGIDANDVTTGQAFNTVANAPLDSIQEFRAVTSGPNSAEGRSSGGQIELTTNSGTNKFHGNLREYYRTEKTAANAFFNNKSNVAIPKLRRHQFGGSLGGPLPFFNFGENNGPFFRSGKDRLFFFFDAEIRRDRSQSATSRTVPLQQFRDGQIGYINNNAGCGTTSRINTTPNCISFQTPAQTAALDPLHAGNNAALLAFINARYPLPNDLTGGNGITTGLLRWNAPNLRDDKIYTIRIDANPTQRQRVFVRTTITRRDSTNSLEFLPGDGDAVVFKDRSWAIAAGHTWAISNALNNVITVGLSKSQNFFTPPSIASFPNSYSGGPIGSPFPSLSYQDRHVFVPTIRDDMSWTKGQHTLQFGVSWKPIQQDSSLINDFNFATLGLGTLALDNTLRPANILPAAVAGYDSAFTYLLGRISTVNTNYNFTPEGTALAPGTGKFRSYAYKEYEFYGQDNWKIRRDLTLNLGVRYHLYPAPYDRKGFQADNTTDFKSFVALRAANAAAGIASTSSEPFLTYNLSGKANNGSPLYKTDYNNFAPRIGFAWNPSFRGGLFGAAFGDKKTVLHGNWSVVYDRVGGAITFIQNQVDYLFANSAGLSFDGGLNPAAVLTTSPRFVSLPNLPVSNTPPTITRPFTPFVSGGVGNGDTAGGGQFNYTIDHNFKIPYAYTFNFGYQRELPGNMLLDVSYVGRLGKSLFVQSDAGQIMNFKDNTSGQFLFDALNAIQPQVAANVAAAAANPAAGIRTWDGITAQPWLENQVSAAVTAFFGAGRNCTNLFSSVAGHPVQNCAQAVARLQPTLVRIGDTSDLLVSMRTNRLLFSNVGLSSQFASNAFISNQGSSDYHGMLLSLQKRLSRGIEFEVNYTYSKSLDNNSTVANTVTGGLVCDVLNPDICRGPSDFDIRHLFNANFIWDLPFGRGRAFGSNVNKWVDGILGGWTLSGIASGRSGLPISTVSGAFPIGFELNSPDITIGSSSAFKVDIHNVGSTIQYFADPVAANNALRFPHHGELGGRNAFRGPWFWGMDLGLSKKFKMPWSERQTITLRADAFNFTNTNAFSTPNLTKDSTSFGLITASSNTPRELQFAIRFDF